MTAELAPLYTALKDACPKLKDKSLPLWAFILLEFEEQEPPMTVRQMFYRMSARAVVDKTENGYRRVQRALLLMRRAGIIPYSHIADGTRWVHHAPSFSDMSEALKEWQQTYRRAMWIEQPVYVEIWVEKDALAGVFYPVTHRYDVPLYVARGYTSETYLQSAAEQIKAVGKPAYIYHFGDYDPSGRDAARDIAGRLRGFGADFHFVEAAVTAQQVTAFHLPTRLTKKTDSRAKKWKGDSVDLDALPPSELRRMVEQCITRHIDPHVWSAVQEIEQQERARIQDLVGHFGTSTKIA